MTEQRIDNNLDADTTASPERQTESEGTAEAIGEPADNVETLRQQLEAAQQQVAESQDRYLRARADMENYKKRIERTYADLARTSKKEILKKLLGVKDNLERALHYGDQAGGNGEGIMDGVRLTEYQLDQLLAQEGVSRIEAQGRPFDPADEEAIQTVHDPNTPDHTVVQVVRQGYMYGDEVLRPAQVIVNVHDSEQ